MTFRISKGKLSMMIGSILINFKNNVVNYPTRKFLDATDGFSYCTGLNWYHSNPTMASWRRFIRAFPYEWLHVLFLHNSRGHFEISQLQ